MFTVMSQTFISYAALGLAILCEVTGSAFLQKSEQFTRPGPTLAMILLFAAAFYLLTHALKVMPLGVAYAIWSGLGIVLTAGVGLVVFRQSLDAAAVAGMGLIIAGVIVINLFSKTAAH